MHFYEYFRVTNIFLTNKDWGELVREKLEGLMKQRCIFLCVLLFLFFSCYKVNPLFDIPPETPEEEAYLENVWATPLDFLVPNEKAETVWARIQGFIGKYSTMKIQIATDYVVQTYNAEYEEFGYTATKTPDVTHTKFSVRCQTVLTNSFSLTDYSKQTELHGHILAYYAITGEVIPRFIKQ